jgi:cation:H+ antiporter
MDWYTVPLLGVSLLLIALLSDRVIRYVVVLSRILGLSEMAAGFILLSVTTSLPELSVSIIAAFMGEGGLSVGNVLGSNVANLTIIVGLAILFSKTAIRVKAESSKELVQFLFISSIIPLFIVQRGSLGPVLGVVLLILFVYFGVTVSRRPEKTRQNQTLEKRVSGMIWLKFTVSVALIILFSKFIIDSSLDIAEVIGLPTSIIGATIVGLGTSLPELATTAQALKEKMFGMALGNLLGSCITNITLILGVSSLISFSTVNVLAVGNIMFYVLVSSLSVWYMIGTGERISRRGALFLCMVYFAFILQQVGVSIFAL